MNLEVIFIGYMYVDGGWVILVGYMSNINFIFVDKLEIVWVIVLVGKYLGYWVIYFDVGSGVFYFVSQDMIKVVCEEVDDLLLIVGGGICLQ